MSRIKGEKWSTVFIEIALRAIRHVHYDYGLWGVGAQWEMDKIRAKTINTGAGIELADERSVCAAITQEFLASPAVAGIWREGDRAKQEEIRFFRIGREQVYKKPPATKSERPKKVDIYLEKLKGKKRIPPPNPSFIEAKRFRLWQFDISRGLAKAQGKSQVEAIKKDVEKLREEMSYREKNCPKETILGHLLIWGIQPTDSPTALVNELNDPGLKIKQTRWLPLGWEAPVSEAASVTVARSLWIVLIEVKQR